MLCSGCTYVQCTQVSSSLITLHLVCAQRVVYNGVECPVCTPAVYISKLLNSTQIHNNVQSTLFMHVRIKNMASTADQTKTEWRHTHYSAALLLLLLLLQLLLLVGSIWPAVILAHLSFLADLLFCHTSQFYQSVTDYYQIILGYWLVTE